MLVKLIAILIVFVVIPFFVYWFFIWKPGFKDKHTDNLGGEPIFIRNLCYTELKEKMGDKFKQLGFKEHPSGFTDSVIKSIFFWTRKTFNINRAVVLIEVNGTMQFAELVDFLSQIKMQLGKEIGYKPFFYELGLQIIILGNSITKGETERNPIDTFNNQEVLIQSLFIIDNDLKKYYKSNTSFQYISGKFQKAIDKVIVDLLTR